MAEIGVDEKWPHMTHEDREYMTGPDNGCWYRWSTNVLGVCVGPVDRADRNNARIRFCRGHAPDDSVTVTPPA